MQPQTNRTSAFGVKIDLEFMTYRLSSGIAEIAPQHFPEEEMSDVIIKIKKLLLEAFVNYVNSGGSKTQLNFDHFHNACDALTYYNIPIELASEVVMKAETDIINSVCQYFPDIDNLSLFKIKLYKILPDYHAYFLMEYVQ